MINTDLQFNEVLIESSSDSFYLTDDGTLATDLCNVDIPNLRQLALAGSGTSFTSITRRNVLFKRSHKGTELEIRAERLRLDIYNRIEAAIDDYYATGVMLNMQIRTADKLFSFNAEPIFPNPLAHGQEFFGDLKDVVFKIKVGSFLEVTDSE